MGKKRGKKKQRASAAAARIDSAPTPSAADGSDTVDPEPLIETVASPSAAGGSGNADAGGDVGAADDTHSEEFTSAQHTPSNTNSSDSASATTASIESSPQPSATTSDAAAVTAGAMPTRHDKAHVNDSGGVAGDDVSDVGGDDVGASVGHLEADACVGESEGDIVAVASVIAGDVVGETVGEAGHGDSKQTASPVETIPIQTVEGDAAGTSDTTDAGHSASFSSDENHDGNRRRITDSAAQRVVDLSAERERVGSPAAVWKAAAVAAARAARESAGAGEAVDDVSVCVDAWREASKVSVTMSHSTLSTPVPTPTPPQETDATDADATARRGAGPMSSRGNGGSRPPSQSARGRDGGKTSSVRHQTSSFFVPISFHEFDPHFPIPTQVIKFFEEDCSRMIK